MLTGKELHRVCAATEKALVPTFVLTIRTKSILELNYQSCLGCLAGVSSECKYAGCNCTDFKNNVISRREPMQRFKKWY